MARTPPPTASSHPTLPTSLSPEVVERQSAPLPLSVSTLMPVALLCLASSVAAAALTAWVVGSNKDDEIGAVRQALHESQARSQVLEVLALNGMSADPARGAVALLNAASAPEESGPAGTPAQEDKSTAASRDTKSAPPPMPPTPGPSIVARSTPATSPVTTTAKVPTTQPSRPGVGAAATAHAAPVAPTTASTTSSKVSAPSAAGATATNPASPTKPGGPGEGAVAATPADTTAQAVQRASPAEQGATGTTGAAAPSTAGAAPTASPKTAATPPGTVGATDRVTLIPAQQLGVAKIEPGVVVMLSGKRVKVGETFESGEVLREADPAKNRIVTDLRTVGLL